jgi:hypothetical protein
MGIVLKQFEFCGCKLTQLFGISEFLNTMKMGHGALVQLPNSNCFKTIFSGSENNEIETLKKSA